ncbi:2858_t:CDS:2 [Paraglomus brasilianum]|uniref:2858_t:CDS:1 n=1 Tax=Paraglomus brasilianum TaxID=144538 RepID=A0A9N8WHY4_9GLOM|nr:2858_t:CDS:2 [Paraglomus brasilianum]
MSCRPVFDLEAVRAMKRILLSDIPRFSSVGILVAPLISNDAYVLARKSRENIILTHEADFVENVEMYQPRTMAAFNQGFTQGHEYGLHRAVLEGLGRL